MNISKFRNSYLIDKSYRLTLVSVTLTALAPLIATLIDGLFSRNLLGNDAFIAVSVSLPIVNAVSVLTMMKLFADTCEMTDEVRSKMYATIQALFDNGVERRSSELKYLDISLTELDDGFQMTIKDCGRPYDPVANGMDAASFGARSATSRYMFTMNVTTIVWDKI